jgi:hypothetical protein
MTKRATVVGSGASGVHFARTLLDRGWEVEMFDVGRDGPAPPNPDDTFPALKRNLTDPVRHLLGEHFEGLTLPGGEKEYYGFPPGKEYVFEREESFEFRAAGFEPLISFARGGLAQAWTAGAFPFGAADLEEFPLSSDDLLSRYGEIAARIGVTGVEDDLAPWMPVHANLGTPGDLDEHSRVLLDRARDRREPLRSKHRCRVGRSRVAVLLEDRDGRGACGYLGRCLPGCPVGALYTPGHTLEECLRHPGFRYRSGRYVSRFRTDGGRRVLGVVSRPAGGGAEEETPVEVLVLAAGTLSTGRIVMESIRRDTGRSVRLPGLMDNRQILVPFVNPAMAGRPVDPATYQYHQVLLGIDGDSAADSIHGIVTTLKATMIHPIVQNLPLDMASALRVFGNLHAALGLVNVNLSDHRRDDCHLSLEDGAPGEDARLVIRYEPPRGERGRIRRAVRCVRGALRELGCFAVPGMAHTRPMGASVHYAGTLPMSLSPAPLTTSPEGRSHDWENLYAVDGSVFPFLPSKNLTFTLMANATRVADRMADARSEA